MPLTTNNGDVNVDDLRYLSSDQALMDYVTLIDYLKRKYHFDDLQAVIGFGGSYGGMLSSWMRFRYPNMIDGVIAASAPILPFEGNSMERYYKPNFFAEGVTYDVTKNGGGVSTDNCEINLRRAFAEKGLANLTTRTTSFDDSGSIKDGAQLIRLAFNLCDDDDDDDSQLGWLATNWLNNALAYMSMGNFPYRSSYILNGAGTLPAYPVRVACDFLSENFFPSREQNQHIHNATSAKDGGSNSSPSRLYRWMQGLSSFGGVYYNYSGTLQCNQFTAPVNNESKVVNMLWDYQYCSQLFMVGGQGPDADDMFWNDPWNGTEAAERCHKQYGFFPDRQHISLTYGTPHDWVRSPYSNIVWSQGEFDPWKGGGITYNLSDTLVGFVIKEAAHHLDLFFSNINDTEAVIEARRFELSMIQKWIKQKRSGTNDISTATAMIR